MGVQQLDLASNITHNLSWMEFGICFMTFDGWFDKLWM